MDRLQFAQTLEEEEVTMLEEEEDGILEEVGVEEEELAEDHVEED